MPDLRLNLWNLEKLKKEMAYADEETATRYKRKIMEIHEYLHYYIYCGMSS